MANIPSDTLLIVEDILEYQDYNLEIELKNNNKTNFIGNKFTGLFLNKNDSLYHINNIKLNKINFYPLHLIQNFPLNEDKVKTTNHTNIKCEILCSIILLGYAKDIERDRKIFFDNIIKDIF